MELDARLPKNRAAGASKSTISSHHMALLFLTLLKLVGVERGGGGIEVPLYLCRTVPEFSYVCTFRVSI